MNSIIWVSDTFFFDLALRFLNFLLVCFEVSFVKSCSFSLIDSSSELISSGRTVVVNVLIFSSSLFGSMYSRGISLNFSYLPL